MNAHPSRREFLKSSALGLTLAGGAGLRPWPAGAQDREIVVYNWYEDFGAKVFDRFKKEAGVKGLWRTYDSMQVLLTTLKTSPGQIDIVALESPWLKIYVQSDLLQPVDISRIPNYKHIFPEFRKLDFLFEGGQQYAVPLTVGAYTILYNKEKVEKPTSIADCWNPKYKGKILMPDFAYLAIPLAALYIGDDPNNPTRWAEIKKVLVEQRKLVVKYWDAYEDAMQMFVRGDALIGVLTIGRAIRAQGIGWNGTFVAPKEGMLGWMDVQSIPKGAPHLDLAYQWIDWSLRPDVARSMPEEEGYKSVSKPAIESLEPSLRAKFDWDPNWKIHFLEHRPRDLRKKQDELWNEVKLG